MYSTRPNLILGFHGCDSEEQRKLILNPEYIRSSREDFDWLGHGMYFWENSQLRARLWAETKQKAGSISEPAVVGAVLDLGRCLDLMDSGSIEILKEAYILFCKEAAELGRNLPENTDHPKDKGGDKVLRYLDCAVIEYTHSLLKEKGEKPFDSVRATLVEGKPIYHGAGFNERTHIQICIINPNCIKGFFLPRRMK